MKHPIYIIMTFTGARDWGDVEADAVFEAFDGDCELGSRGDFTFIEVPAPAGDVWQHVPRLVQTARKALPHAKLIRVELDDLAEAAPAPEAERAAATPHRL